MFHINFFFSSSFPSKMKQKEHELRGRSRELCYLPLSGVASSRHERRCLALGWRHEGRVASCPLSLWKASSEALEEEITIRKMSWELTGRSTSPMDSLNEDLTGRGRVKELQFTFFIFVRKEKERRKERRKRSEGK